MKITITQPSATYLLPDPGELNKRITIRRRVDLPADDMGVEASYPESFETWAKMAQPGAATYQGSVQTGTTVTHFFTIRFRDDITADHEIFFNETTYRIRRQRDLNSARRYLLLECEELGSEVSRANTSDTFFR
jgi:SPP1 family predicted phage head-tail adaptor